MIATAWCFCMHTCINLCSSCICIYVCVQVRTYVRTYSQLAWLFTWSHMFRGRMKYQLEKVRTYVRTYIQNAWSCWLKYVRTYVYVSKLNSNSNRNSNNTIVYTCMQMYIWTYIHTYTAVQIVLDVFCEYHLILLWLCSNVVCVKGSYAFAAARCSHIYHHSSSPLDHVHHSLRICQRLGYRRVQRHRS